MNSDFSYQSKLRIKHQEFASLKEFIDFIDFLGNGNSTDLNASFENQEYTYSTSEFSKLLDEMNSAKSIYNITMSIQSNETIIDFTYTSLNLIKNNATISLSSNSIEKIRETQSKINEELRKYKNPTRRNFINGVSILFGVVLFLSMFSGIVPTGNIIEGDFSFSSSLFFDLIIATGFPVLFSFFIYQAFVPTIRIKSNKGFINSLKIYLSRDYKSIIKDIVLATIFLLLGLLIK
ncbi:hypothetical protein PAECIP111894_01961 [Paenibacillus pseudetheri]|uniref:Uncharacterized protein n=2 Tax=Paenibacillus pseudetheri TaxID=2897682 RepID=A0ABN8FD42_9BACL|nr:hypothetical protein PAECIP111894_01961 [Paenibacillus pseudetheri]